MSEPPSKRRRVDVYRSSRPQGDYRSVGHPFSVLPMRVVLDILREWYFLKVVLRYFHKEMSHSDCVPSDKGMDQSDYFGRFMRDRTRTVWQLFFNLHAVLNDHGDDCRFLDLMHLNSGMHLNFPRDVRSLNLTSYTSNAMSWALHVAILKTAQNFPNLRVLNMGLAADHFFPTVDLMISCPFASLERCTYPLWGYLTRTLDFSYLPSPQYYFHALRCLPSNCKMRFVGLWYCSIECCYTFREWNTKQAETKIIDLDRKQQGRNFPFETCIRFAYQCPRVLFKIMLKDAQPNMRDRIGDCEFAYLPWKRRLQPGI